MTGHTWKESVRRVLPEVTERNQHFWRGGASGRLHVQACDSCSRYLHPPTVMCRWCGSQSIRPVGVSGRGVVYSFTVNRYAWQPDLPPPYVIALVDLVEQEGLRVMSNIVDVDPDDVTVGMEVEATFAEHGDVFVPLFRPVAARPQAR